MRSLGLKCGNFNLKGKKSKKLSCQCGVARNLKEKSEQKRIQKEISDEINY